MLHFMKMYESKLTLVLYMAVCMAIKTNINCKALSVIEKLEIIKKVDGKSHVMYTKVAE
jgi:hypothetical protein